MKTKKSNVYGSPSNTLENRRGNTINQSAFKKHSEFQSPQFKNSLTLEIRDSPEFIQEINENNKIK